MVSRTLSTGQRYPRDAVSCSVSYQWLSLCLALGYALVLASLPVDVFEDRGNYLNYASHSGIIFERYLAQGWLSAFSNEPVVAVAEYLISHILVSRDGGAHSHFFPSFRCSPGCIAP